MPRQVLQPPGGALFVLMLVLLSALWYDLSGERG